MAEKAVLVIGGGIAGMQAALDVADAGYKVYLVEKEGWIGGHMAQLDKTFPTNDCAMCTISPKLTEVGQHPNIELLTNSVVVSLEGQEGEFTARILKRPRFVDPSKCNACGECVKACPVELPNEFDRGLSKRKAIYKAYPQAIPNAMAITKLQRPPCVLSCSAGVNVQGYIALLLAGKYEEAYELIWEKNPFVGTCGRVCYHPCEKACNRNQVDEPVAINLLKRFLSDWARDKGIRPNVGVSVDLSKPKVAVVGSGPAGLTAARDLLLMGYPVTVFEAAPYLGGMLSQAIPPYRLPREVLQFDIERIVGLGLEVRTGVRVGKDTTLEQLRAEGYKAIFLALGLPKGQGLRVEGSELKGVISALDFLREVNAGGRPSLKAPVVVIGGGNTAIDAARTALRLGIRDVVVLYRRTEEEMPASPEEVQEAKEEGVRFEFLVAPVRFLGKGEVEAVVLQRMELGEPDESGRRRPVPVPGSEFVKPVGTVILAIGQIGDLDWVRECGIRLTEMGTIEVDPFTLQTSVPDVFAGGDVVTGPGFVVDAIGQGHQAAISIDRFLRGVDLREGRGRSNEPAPLPRFSGVRSTRVRPKRLEASERIQSFEEVELTLGEREAKEEASRCLQCGICCECFQCVKACEQKAIDHSQKEEELVLSVGAVIVATGYGLFDPRKKPEYGYGRIKGVITGLELERLMSSSGPTGGDLTIDGKRPKEVVFIQCVGSRDRTVDRPYCSRVCCMYVAKQAQEVKERLKEARVTICYMDVRAYGKGYEGLYERIQRRGVIYRRGIPSEVYERGGKVVLRAEDTLLGRPYELEADLVVLACGLGPSEGVRELASVLGLEVDENGFFKEANPLDPVVSTRPGVFLAGCCQGPKDISDSVAQASGAAARALALISRVKS